MGNEMMDQEERLDRVMREVKRVKAAPSLRMVNGSGQSLFGRFHLPGMDKKYFSMLFACVLFVPLLPHALYLVEDDGGVNYRFYGRIGMGRLLRLLTPGERRDLLVSVARVPLVRIALVVLAMVLVYQGMAALY